MASYDNIVINTPSGTLGTKGSSTVSGSASVATVSSGNSGITLTNLGDGSQVFQGKGTGNVYNLRSIEQGYGTVITQDANTIRISFDPSSVQINDERYSSLANLKDVDVDPKAIKKGQILTFNGEKWQPEDAPIPKGTSVGYVFHLPVIIKAGAAGVTGFGQVPEGWTVSVTDPATPPYNITVNHTTGLIPVSMSISYENAIDPTVNNVITLGTNLTTSPYIIGKGDGQFMIYNASATNMKMAPNGSEDQIAIIHILMA